MRVMIDTNIFISAALFPKGRAAEVLYKALCPPYEPVVCDYVLDELHRKFREKFPKRTVELEAFLYMAFPAFTVVPTPEEIWTPKLRSVTRRTDPSCAPRSMQMPTCF
jgi:predicted nucleic acid-binding protein